MLETVRKGSKTVKTVNYGGPLACIFHENHCSTVAQGDPLNDEKRENTKKSSF